jgi:hypothetical protein
VRRPGAVAVTLVLAMAVVGCSPGIHPGSADRAPASRTLAPATSPSCVRPSPAAHPPYAVGSVSAIFTDTSRAVSGAHTLGGLPGPRVLRTLILYPAARTPRPAGTRSPRIAPAGEHFPLVVFAPGFDQGPSSYLPLLKSWARSGFVVAAVTFPLTSPNAVGGWTSTTS